MIKLAEMPSMLSLVKISRSIPPAAYSSGVDRLVELGRT
jgi:hypothetical protein